MSLEFSSTEAQHLLNRLVDDFLKQQKRQRRWGWVKKGLYAVVVGFFIYNAIGAYLEEKRFETKPHVGVIDIKGEISDLSFTNSDSFSHAVHKAFKNKYMKALILRINSPGGSPVQADYMYNTLMHYRQKNPQLKVYAVCMDTCASAAYYVASAAEEVYANPSSLVGSIGVLYNGFGFDQLMGKLGISRRLETAGKNKGFLDPFSPETPEQKRYLHQMLDQIHQQFIAKVKQGRGSRLKINSDLFTGLAWTGVEAKNLGLIDGFASTGELLRDKIKIENAIDYTEKPNFMEQVSRNIGASLNVVINEWFQPGKFI